jgi:glycosyltransferase involved in cell wall biosynthesis
MTNWINVSTSSTWSGSPVGIVRVEKSLEENLSMNWKRFVISNHSVTEFKEKSFKKMKKIESEKPVSKIDSYMIFLRTTPRRERILRILAFTYSIAEDFFANLLKEKNIQRIRHNAYSLSRIINKEIGGKKRLNTASPKNPKLSDPFVDGDLILTCGLDWDTETFITLAKIKESKPNLQIVSFVYDLISVQSPEMISNETHSHVLFRHFVLLAKTSNLVVCISEKVKHDFIDFCKKLEIETPKVVVQYLASFTNEQIDLKSHDFFDQKMQHILKRRFFLTIGTIEPRKNYQTLINAAKASAKDDFLIVIAGRNGWNSDGIIHELKVSRILKDRVIWVDSPSDIEIMMLFRNCLAYISASSMEGFNLPVLEAMSLGIPLILSDIPVHRELFPLAQFVPIYDTKQWNLALTGNHFDKKEYDLGKFPVDWKEYAHQIMTKIESNLLC